MQEFARILFELNTSQKNQQECVVSKPVGISPGFRTTYNMCQPASTSQENYKPKREMPLSYVRQSIASRPITPMKLDSRDNCMKDMYSSESDLLANVRFSVFALGSTAYPNFCAFGHYMDKMLYDLGGERICDLMEGDELSNEEESFRIWAKDVFKAACDTFCVVDSHIVREATSSLSDTEVSWSPTKFRLLPIDEETEVSLTSGLSKLHKRNVQQVKLIEKRNLQAVHSSRQTLLMRFDSMSEQSMMYLPGDHIGIYPDNNAANVEYIISRLVDAPEQDKLLRFEVLTESTTIFGSKFVWEPTKKFPLFTLRRMFTNYLDINAPPSPMLLQLLATQATDLEEQKEIDLLAKSSSDYNTWKQRKMPNLATVLRQFPSIYVLPTLLIQHLPLLQQRYYSISSSPDMYRDQIHSTVSLVQYTLPDEPDVIHEGVCSEYFTKLNEDAIVPAFIRKAKNFRMPEDNTLPLILVAAGCGIAPLRSFWQQRQVDMSKLPPPIRAGQRGWGDMTLFFGCRRDDTDNIYKEEINDLIAKGVLSKFNLALSRDSTIPKTYVQHLMLQHSSYIYKCLFKRGGHFFVCGDVTMAAGVSTALEDIVEEISGCTWDEAKLAVIKLREDNRFHEDIFGVTPKSVEPNIKTIARDAFRHYNESTDRSSMVRSPTPEHQIRRISNSTDV